MHPPNGALHSQQAPLWLSMLPRQGLHGVGMSQHEALQRVLDVALPQHSGHARRQPHLSLSPPDAHCVPLPAPSRLLPALAPRRKIEAALKPVKLQIVDESYKHAGHSGNPSGAADAETHFK